MTDPARPKMRDGLLFRQIEEDFVIYDPRCDQTALMNLTAALIVDLCDGSKTSVEIVEAVAQCFGKEVSEVEGDVRQILKELSVRGFLVRPET